MGAAAVAGFLGGRTTAEEETRTVVQTRTRDVSVCANTAYGFALAYPRGWHTDDLGPESACFFFDPKPFEVPENSDFGGTALEVLVAQEDPDALVRSMVDPRFARSARRADVIVGGRSAVRVEYVTTGAGLLDAGTRVYAYVFDRDELPPVLVQTTARPGARLRRDVADLAARTLLLFRPAVSELPTAVAETRSAIVAAARARDLAALRRLIPAQGFTFSFGAPAQEPVDYWVELERTTDERPFDTLATILELPYTLNRGLYVWPFAYDKSPDELTDYERELLGELADDFAGDSYLGWRAGIEPDGDWVFFVAGD